MSTVQVAPKNLSEKPPEPVESGGITSNAARERLNQDGPNALPDTSVHPLQNLVGKLWAPVPWLLEASIVLELVLHKFFEATIIAGLLFFNAGLAYFQEGRAQATLAALKSRLALNASVRRDGVWKVVPATGLVRGDIIKLSLGGVVAADVHIIEGSVLLDQSMLTGESLPLEAGAGFDTYAGALVRRGEATAVATATAILTLGKFRIGLGMEELRTLSVVAIVFGSQAIMYATRERRHFLGMRPTIWVVGSSFADIFIISTLAVRGIAMAPLPISVVAFELAAAVVFWLVLSLIKIPIFSRLGIP